MTSLTLGAAAGQVGVAPGADASIAEVAPAGAGASKVGVAPGSGGAGKVKPAPGAGAGMAEVALVREESAGRIPRSIKLSRVS